MEHRDSQSTQLAFENDEAEDDIADPLLCSSRSSIANVLQAARASLKNPSRPYTPRDSSRKLFTGNDYLRRPDSSYGLPSSKSFLESSQSTRPQGNLPPLGPIPSGSQTRGGSAGARGASPFRERSTNRAPSRGSRPSSPSPPPPAQPQAEPIHGMGCKQNEKGRQPVEGNQLISLPKPSEILVVHHPAPDVPVAKAPGAGGQDARSVARVHSADSMTRPGPPPPPGAKPASARAASPTRAHMERASSLQCQPTSYAHRRAPTDAPPVQAVPLHPDPRSLSTPRTPSLRQSGMGLPVGGSKPTAAYQAQLDRHAQGEEEAGRASCHRDDHFPPGEDSGPAMEDMPECQDDVLAGSFLVQDEAHEAWCAEVEETIDGMAHSLAALAKSRAPDQRHTADVAEALDQLRSLVAAASERREGARWLSCAAAGSMTAVTPREAVLHQVFRVMDCGQPALLIKACTVTLHVAQDAGPLRNAFKALFKLSKDARNDAAFRRERALAALLRALGDGQGGDAHPRNALSTEALVYAAGTLKNASTDPANQRVLIEEGAVPALIKMLSKRCACDDERATVARPTSASGRPRSATSRPSSAARPASGGDEAAQLAVQLTGTLRNIAVMSNAATQFAESHAMPVFASLIGRFVRHSELMLNVARIVAKLSSDSTNLRHMSKDEEFVRQLMELLRVHPDHSSLVLRVTFLLGNLTVNNNRNRLTIGQKFGGADLFVALIGRYTWKRPSSASSTSARSDSNSEASQSQSLGREDGAAESAGAAETSTKGKTKSSDKSRSKADSESDAQVLVKLVRLVANLAIHPQLGPEISRMGSCASALRDLLQKHSGQGSADSAELVLNVVSAITNLSFYEVEDNAVLGLRASTPRFLTPLLLSDNPEAQVEAARAFGNFSRHPEVRDYMANARVVEALCLLLDHSNRDVLYSVCGVLMNFTSDQAHLCLLAEADGVSMLIDLLGRALLEGDLPLGTLVCKTLCNLCSTPRQGGEGADAPPPLFTGPDMHELTQTLTRAISHYQAKASEVSGARATKEPEHAARVEEAMEASEFADLASRLCSAIQNVPVCNDDEQDDSDGAGDLEPLEGPVRPNV